MRIYIIGMGIISPLGCGTEQTKAAIIDGHKGIKPLTLFSASKILPVGKIPRSLTGTWEHAEQDNIPRTHQLALIAAKEATANIKEPPDAVVLGGTTGGILTTEEHLKAGDYDPKAYQYHSISSVAEYIARKFNCRGPVLSISTACSSGTAAIKTALEMLRSGKVKRVLTGGADSLCRLTYYGFNSLQLIDPEGSRPFDKNRKGMNVSEGAAILFLTATDHPPDNAVAEILGGGLSCDAHHATAPHPEGKGAFNAMMSAMEDAGISPNDIDYINLHGTGTKDNDLSEAKGIRAIWGDKVPYLSSVKGASGHPIAAAGAIEAVISALCIVNQIIPANAGYHEFDPEINIAPVQTPLSGVKLDTVLSNSFGFGGNNASVIIGNPNTPRSSENIRVLSSHFSILGSSCITGAGDTEKTLNALLNGSHCKGTAPIEDISKALPSKLIRRMKRMPRLSLALALSACSYNCGHAPISPPYFLPSSIFFGTGWGSLSETYDFLTKLYESEERFTSPTDFTGSVHNAPAGQIAIMLKSLGANITATAGDYSFEHALFIADVLTKKSDDTVLVAGADEFHPIFSPLFDPSVLPDETPSDGGGAFFLTKRDIKDHVKLFPIFFEYTGNNPDVISSLILKLGGSKMIHDRFGAVFIGIPKGFRNKADEQLNQFLSGISEPCTPLIIDYRGFLGEFASASAAAAVIASHFVMKGKIPANVCSYSCKKGAGAESAPVQDFHLNGKSILMLNFGEFVTAIYIYRDCG